MCRVRVGHDCSEQIKTIVYWPSTSRIPKKKEKRERSKDDKTNGHQGTNNTKLRFDMPPDRDGV
jgi:hypothetical protein